jgi:hypothetical protein
MTLFCAIFAAALLSATAGPSAAHSLVYTASFSGANESPANDSLGTGFVTVTVDLDLITMRIEGSFEGLGGVTGAAHIHCCLVPAGPLNVGVATQVPSFPGFPLGVQAGSFDQTYDMSQDSSYNPAFITASGGTVGNALNALLAGLAGGNSYFNIHTSTFQGGEIRGNLIFDHEVPEPAVLGLVALGLGALVLRRRVI